jgi:hypothetical protein
LQNVRELLVSDVSAGEHRYNGMLAFRTIDVPFDSPQQKFQLLPHSGIRVGGCKRLFRGPDQILVYVVLILHVLIAQFAQFCDERFIFIPLRSSVRTISQAFKSSFPKHFADFAKSKKSDMRPVKPD